MKTENYKLSYVQKILWVLYKMEPVSSTYNIQFSKKVTGKFNTEVFKEAIRVLVARHEILRTNFREIEGQPKQIVNQFTEPDFKIYDLSKIENKKRNSEYSKIFYKEINYPFKLENDHLIRFRVIKVDGTHFTIIFLMHHIISDAWSVKVIASEISELYNSLIEKKIIKSTELPIQYKDYAEWEQSPQNQKNISKQEKYWLKYLSGKLPRLDLLQDKYISEKECGDGIDSVSIDKSIVGNLKKMAANNKTTIFSVLFSALNILMARISNQTDVIIGTWAANRDLPELQSLVGILFNTLAVRSDLKDDIPFLVFLQKTHANILNCMSNKDYPFYKIVEKINPDRNNFGSPLFNVAFQYAKAADSKIDFKGLSVDKNIPYTPNIVKFELLFRAVEFNGLIKLFCEYKPDYFSKKNIAALFEMFGELLKNILKNPNQKIGDLEILTKGQKMFLLDTINKTNYKYPSKKTINQHFEEVALKHPQKIISDTTGVRITYKELNAKANMLARNLLARGIKKGDSVGIMLNRSVEFVVADLAIHKAGCVSLPIEINYPAERIDFMLNDSGAKLAIVSAQGKNNAKIKFKNFFNIDKFENNNKNNLHTTSSPLDPSYVLYTSGSTGKPKGVMLTHRGVINQVYHRKKMLNIKENDILCHSGMIGFVVTPLQIYIALFSGCKLVVFDEKDIRDSRLLFDLINKHKIKAVEVGTLLLDSYLNSISDKMCKKYPLVNLKKVFIAGSKLSTVTASLFYKYYPKIELINAYGQTECSGMTLFGTVPKSGRVFEGKPTSNNQVYVLDKKMRLVPPGFIGELYVSGHGLAKGYLNDPEKTKRTYLPHPFKKGEKIYKTGDFVKMMPDGNIIYISRADQQIKIRGNRVEIGEIEVVLSKYPPIKKILILAKQDDKKNDNYLIAYFIAKEKIKIQKLRDYASNFLPDFMIPGYFVQLDSFPQNVNGKIDRFALPTPNCKKAEEKYNQPKTELEKKIAAIWIKVLKVDKISTSDILFNLGGHSIKILEISAKMKAELGIDVPIVKFFQYPTIKAIIKYIKNGESALLSKNFGKEKNNIKQIFQKAKKLKNGE